jgi:hypothetical protein
LEIKPLNADKTLIRKKENEKSPVAFPCYSDPRFIRVHPRPILLRLVFFVEFLVRLRADHMEAATLTEQAQGGTSS